MASAHLVTLILVTETVGKGVKDDPIQTRQLLITPTGRIVATRSALGDLNHVFDNDGWGELDSQTGGRP